MWFVRLEVGKVADASAIEFAAQPQIANRRYKHLAASREAASADRPLLPHVGTADPKACGCVCGMPDDSADPCSEAACSLQYALDVIQI